MRKFPNFPGYKVEKILGEGGMATVYLGLHKKLNRKVAIKVIYPYSQPHLNLITWAPNEIL